MEININEADSLRVTTKQREIFVNIKGTQWESAIEISLVPFLHYVEMREKGDALKLFVFKNKHAKKEFDFGSWTDASIVFAQNKVIHDK